MSYREKRRGKNRRKLFDTQMKDDSSGTFCATKPKICKVYFLRCIRGSNSVVSDSIVSLGVRGVFIYVVNETVQAVFVQLHFKGFICFKFV